MLDILKFLFFLGIGILLIWLAIHNKTEQELDNIKIAFQQANYFWISLSIVISGLSHYFRAVRWKLMLKPLGYVPKTSNTFFALLVGYLANFALPRLGEVSRCGLLTKYEKIPFTEAFGTVIAERALDVLCVIILFFAILTLEFNRISGLANDLVFNTVSVTVHNLMEKQAVVVIMGVTLISMTAVFFYFRRKIHDVLSGKIKGFVNGLWDGLRSIKNVEKPLLFIFHTSLIWLMYILQVYVCFFAFEGMSHLSFIVAIVIVIFGSLGVIVVPGGTGAYQAIVIQILTTVYLTSGTIAFAFAWAVWTSQFLLILSFGLISLLLLAILNKNVNGKN